MLFLLTMPVLACLNTKIGKRVKGHVVVSCQAHPCIIADKPEWVSRMPANVLSTWSLVQSHRATAEEYHPDRILQTAEPGDRVDHERQHAN